MVDSLKRTLLIAAALGLAGWWARPARTAQEPVTLLGAGDIADCGSRGDELTAAILDSIPGTIFTTGDNAYPDGSRANFADCFEPTWGRHKARIRPAPGNHDYHTRGASGYFDYYGAAAGEAGRGYYSYDLGEWHVVSLNTVAAVGANSPQLRWLRADLNDNRRLCTVVYFHHPRFSSAAHGGQRNLRALWDVLYEARVDIAMAGHDHTYERFAPQSANGRRELRKGVRQFVVGTGGRGPYRFYAPWPNSEFRHTGDPGLLVLKLHPERYDWEFVRASDRKVLDRGNQTCH